MPRVYAVLVRLEILIYVQLAFLKRWHFCNTLHNSTVRESPQIELAGEDAIVSSSGEARYIDNRQRWHFCNIS